MKIGVMILSLFLGMPGFAGSQHEELPVFCSCGKSPFHKDVSFGLIVRVMSPVFHENGKMKGYEVRPDQYTLVRSVFEQANDVDWSRCFKMIEMNGLCPSPTPDQAEDHES